MKVVSDMLGHASLSITADTYSHVTAELAHQAAEDIARAILGPWVVNRWSKSHLNDQELANLSSDGCVARDSNPEPAD